MSSSGVAFPWISHESAFEEDVSWLKQRIKQVGKFYLLFLAATLLWLVTTTTPGAQLKTIKLTLPFPLWTIRMKQPVAHMMCTKSLLVKLGKDTSVEVEIVKYVSRKTSYPPNVNFSNLSSEVLQAQWAAVGRAMNYTVIPDDSNWYHGRLRDYFDLPSPSCLLEPGISRVWIGSIAWETQPHLVVDNAESYLDQARWRNGVPCRREDRRNQPTEAGLVGADSPFADHLDARVSKELARVWKPNKKINAQVELLDQYVHTCYDKVSSRSRSTRRGRARKLKIPHLFAVYGAADEPAEFSRKLEASFEQAQSHITPGTGILALVLFGNPFHLSLNLRPKSDFLILATPTVSRFSDTMKVATSQHRILQTEVIIRDLTYVMKYSNHLFLADHQNLRQRFFRLLTPSLLD